jgi:methylmalonyl-CoA mutase N-terminal domain/subunit
MIWPRQRLRTQQVIAYESGVADTADLLGGSYAVENLMPRIIAAVEAYATLGEVADAMRRVFGEYSEAI